MAIEIQQVERRLYFRGDTYSVKDRLRSAGAKWDPEQKAWWIGSGKREEAERLVAKYGTSAVGERQQESIGLDDEVIRGSVRVTKDGKDQYYYLLADGTSQRTGKAYMKVCFRDGSRVFWVQDPAQARVLKRYDEPLSITQLRAYAEKAKSYGTRGCRCSCHTSNGHFGTGGHSLFDGCDRCGCEDDG